MGHASHHAGTMPTPVSRHGGRQLTDELMATRRRPNGKKVQIDTASLLRYVTAALPTPTKRDGRMDAWSPAYDRRKSPAMDAGRLPLA